MSEQLTSIVEALEALEPFAIKAFANESDHECVAVWYTMKGWHVCGPDTPMTTHYNIMDAAGMIAKELEHIL